MERRFTLKDLLILILLVLVLISIWLGMKQDDRQLTILRRNDQQLDELTAAQARLGRDLHKLNTKIEQGVTVNGAADPNASGGKGSPFARVKAAQEMDGYAEGDWLVDSFGNAIQTLTPLVSSDVCHM